MTRLALYPGTFDPFTLGHLNIARRALRLFDQVDIIVARNLDKNVMMPIERRASVIRASIENINNLAIRTFEGLIAPYAAARGAIALVRGVRSASDFTYEATMAKANEHLNPSLETVILATAPEYAHISSSLVREVARWGGDLTHFVPPPVAVALADYYNVDC